MKIQWLTMAVIAAGLGAGTAAAQSGYMPTPVGAARLPEPVPNCQPLPPMTTGPLNSYTAPPGPPDCLNLPAGHTSAFQCEEYVRDNNLYVTIGALGLQRQKMGNHVLAVLDPNNIDTGIPPGPSAAPLANLNDISERVLWGGTATIGYLCEDHAFEARFSGFTPKNENQTYIVPGRIDTLFFNPPLGFEGNNNLFLQADELSVSREMRYASAEANFRCTGLAFSEVELIFGVRYVYFNEKLNINVNDDVIQFPTITGLGDPRRAATYSATAQNNFLGLQMGAEYDKAVCSWLSLGVSGKAAVGVNMANLENSLIRGDGFVGFDLRETNTIPLSQVYDLNAYIEIHVPHTDRIRLRGAYNFLYLVGTNVTQDQINFNLSSRQIDPSKSGSVYFQGPSLELELLF